MSGTLINSRQEEIIHKLPSIAKKENTLSERKAMQTIFLHCCQRVEKKGSHRTRKQAGGRQAGRQANHSNLVPSNYK